MPPVRWLPPTPIALRAPSMKPRAMKKPERVLGSTIVAAGPRFYQTYLIDTINNDLKKYFGKQNPLYVDVHATRAGCRRIMKTKMGGGRGPISYFAGEVPAGKTIVVNPTMPAFEDHGCSHQYLPYQSIADKLPNTCVIRSQFNRFNEQTLEYQQSAMRRARIESNKQVTRSKLCQSLNV